MSQIASKVTVKAAGKIGTKFAIKTGGILSAKLGSAFLDTTIGVGILFWDIWDVNHTANIEKPFLKQNLGDYLEEVKKSLLNDPQTGVMVTINSIQKTIVDSIQSNPQSSLNKLQG